MKSIDMNAFVGRDFDCEFMHVDRYGVYSSQHYNTRPDWHIGKLRKADVSSRIYNASPKPVQSNSFNLCKPRINKAQVLDDWSWVPDGLVWRNKTFENLKSKQVRNYCNWDTESYECWFECIGVEAGKCFDEWAEAHAMPLIELGGA